MNKNYSKNPYYTTYSEAVNWLNNDFVLCNNIPDIDQSIWDNMRFSYYDDDDNPIEIYQWYITNANKIDVEYLENISAYYLHIATC